MIALFLLGALAAYRITRLSVYDTLSETIRGDLRDRAADAKNYVPWPFLDDLLTCSWCFGFWVSGAVTFALTYYFSILLPVLWWFAMSTIVGLLGEIDSKLSN